MYSLKNPFKFSFYIQKVRRQNHQQIPPSRDTNYNNNFYGDRTAERDNDVMTSSSLDKLNKALELLREVKLNQELQVVCRLKNLLI